MTTWDLELIMMLLVAGAQQWLIVPMVQGNILNLLCWCCLSFAVCWGMVTKLGFYIFFNCFLWVWAGFVDVCRLFSCGTSKEGESFIVEWNESEGAVKRTYHGFRKRSSGVVQFDTTKNRFLAAGDDFSIKFWDMDNVQLLTTVEADGGIPVGLSSRYNNWKQNNSCSVLSFLLPRQAHESGSTRMALSWLFLPMRMELKF